MMPGTAEIEGGKVIIPQDAVWLADFLKECSAFPKGRHDDQVDSMSQFLDWAREKRKMYEDGEHFIEAVRELADNDDNDGKDDEDIKDHFRRLWGKPSKKPKK